MIVSSFAVLSLILPPFSLLSSAGIALTVLRNGAAEAVVVLIGTTAAIALLGLFSNGNLPVVIGYGLMLWLPICFIALVLRESRQLAFAIELSVILGVVAVGVVYLLLSDPASLWNERLQAAVEILFQGAMADVDQQPIIQSIERISHYMSGLVIAGALASLLLGLMLARWWQSILYNPGGFRAEFLGLRSHRVLAYTSLAVVLIATITDGGISEAFWNMAIITSVLYLMVGISVFHKILSATKIKQLALTLLYLIMLFVPHALLPVALVGLTDAWLDWRNKF